LQYDKHMVAERLLSLASLTGTMVEKYYLALSSLTPKDALAQTPIAGTSGLPLGTETAFVALYTPVAVFIIIFITVFGIFLVGRIRNWKMGITAFLLALTLAATPYALNVMKYGVDGAVNAGPDEIPRNVRIVPLSKTSVQVVWDTDTPKIGAVRMSPEPYAIENARIIIGNSRDKTTSHAVLIDNLVNGKTYECEVLSGSRWYDNKGNLLVFRMVQ
jgi:hypothetical protein